MNPQFSTSPGDSKAAAASNLVVGPQGMGGAVPSTSGSTSAAVQQQEKHVFLNRASLKQCEQLFGSTCRVKLHRCKVPIPVDVPCIANFSTPSAKQRPTDLRTLRKIDVEGEPDSEYSNENEVKVLEVLPPPPSKVSKKKTPSAKKKSGEKVAHRKLSVHCRVCGRTMTSKYILKIHMQKHSGEMRSRNRQNKDYPRGKKRSAAEWRPKGAWKCKVCEKRMKSGTSYMNHMSIHRGEKPFKCDECGKAFRLNEFLSKHKRIHSGVWQLSCLFCNKGFHQQFNMFRHLRIHTEEKPYFCAVEGCGESFRYLDVLKYHRLLIHLKKY